MHKLFIIICLLMLPISIFAIDLSNFEMNDNTYIIRLNNGDLLTGVPIEVNQNEKGYYIKFKTMLGSPIIFDSEITEMTLKTEYNKVSHRHFLMPSAEPISDNHFIGLAELLMFYGGFGISDYVSVTLGRTLVPYLNQGEQISFINLKGTVYTQYWESMAGWMSVGVGGNLGFLNDRNRLEHLFLNASFTGERSTFTGMLFSKVGGENFFPARFGSEVINVQYQGSIGLGLGLTTKFSDWHNLSFVGELWNPDLEKLSSAIIAGLRIGNSKLTADFGLCLITNPANILPVVTVVWHPF